MVRFCVGCLIALISIRAGLAQDQFVFYFSGAATQVGTPGSFTFDANGDFWAIGRDANVTLGPQITKLSEDGGNWTADAHVADQDMFFFYRSTDLEQGIVDTNVAGSPNLVPASFLLNPAPLTLTIPTGSGGTIERTYQPGELAFISDAQRELADENDNAILDATKKIYRYDLRKVDNPDAGIDGSTTDVPDFANAKLTEGANVLLPFGSAGRTDFNDAFAIVMSEQAQQDAIVASLTADFNSNLIVGSTDLQIWQDNYGLAADGSTGDANGNGHVEGTDFLTWQRQFGLSDGGADGLGQSFAWSSDGQSIYIVGFSRTTGGIYRVDATQQDVATRIWIDAGAGARINTEPAVLHTSVRDLDPSNPDVGDQIIVEGSSAGGNIGGVNVFLDTGASTVEPPTPLFTEAEFRDFAEYIGTSSPEYRSITNDAAGNLYFYEIGTDGVFMYDTQGRFAKIASEAEHNDFQADNGSGPNDIVLDMQVRTSMAPGFAVNEIIYTDDGLDAPVGILAFKIGDFDRDDDADGDDFGLFAAALGTRGAPANAENNKFDLNGNAVLFFDAEDQEFKHESNGPVVVDWKDVKILQQFADIPDGDANFDGALDFLDLDIMEANYFTIAGQDAETWADGDFASVDPAYAFDAVDANLVNMIDLQVIADTWVNVLGQDPVDETDADAQGYTGQFRTDLLAAFAATGGLTADFNGDTFVDELDLQIWEDNYGSAADGSTGDADGNGVANGADFLAWQRQFTGSSSLAASTALVPEPTTLCLVISFALASLNSRRR